MRPRSRDRGPRIEALGHARPLEAPAPRDGPRLRERGLQARAQIAEGIDPINAKAAAVALPPPQAPGPFTAQNPRNRRSPRAQAQPYPIWLRLISAWRRHGKLHGAEFRSSFGGWATEETDLPGKMARSRTASATRLSARIADGEAPEKDRDAINASVAFAAADRAAPSHTRARST